MQIKQFAKELLEKYKRHEQMWKNAIKEAPSEFVDKALEKKLVAYKELLLEAQVSVLALEMFIEKCERMEKEDVATERAIDDFRDTAEQRESEERERHEENE